MLSNRLQSIDQLRGLVMLLMLVDHVRERFYLYLQVGDPMNLQQIDNSLAFTRLLAHFCAPTFVFLTGLSAWLYAQKHSAAALSSFLYRRGLFLLVLEMTLVNLSWFGTYQTLYLQVIWVLGWCMVLLGLLQHLPKSVLWPAAILLIAGHNLLTPIQFQPHEWGYSLWTILHDRGFLLTAEQGPIAIKISYPLLPWVGVILLGYLAGALFSGQALQRQRVLLRAAGSALLLLVFLRASHVYGETLPWHWFDCVAADSYASQTLGCAQSHIKTLLSFFNLTKYPPSFDFLLFTLAGMAIVLVGMERFAAIAWYRPIARILANFGAAPMFFYLLHLYALLLLYSIAVVVFGQNKGQYFGVDAVWQLWVIAALLAMVLYFPTRWFAHYKQQSKAAWVRYL